MGVGGVVTTPSGNQPSGGGAPRGGARTLFPFSARLSRCVLVSLKPSAVISLEYLRDGQMELRRSQVVGLGLRERGGEREYGYTDTLYATSQERVARPCPPATSSASVVSLSMRWISVRAGDLVSNPRFLNSVSPCDEALLSIHRTGFLTHGRFWYRSCGISKTSMLDNVMLHEAMPPRYCDVMPGQ